MKKLSIKNITTSILTLCLIGLLSVSCSSSDETPEPDPTVEFTKFDVSKTDAFIEDKILIEFEGNGYTDLVITSDNPAVTITKKAATTFELSSATSANAYIYVALNNKTKKASKGINISFNEHGTKDFNTVEGIKKDVDNSSKVLTLLGEPDQKADSSSDPTLEIWTYGTKGLAFFVIKSTTIVKQINMYSSYYDYKTSTAFTNYPYTIGNGWKINNDATTMDMIVNELGTPSSKSTSATSSTNRGYTYVNKQLTFRFYSDSEDNFAGKKIIYCSFF